MGSGWGRCGVKSVSGWVDVGSVWGPVWGPVRGPLRGQCGAADLLPSDLINVAAERAHIARLVDGGGIPPSLRRPRPIQVEIERQLGAEGRLGFRSRLARVPRRRRWRKDPVVDFSRVVITLLAARVLGAGERGGGALPGGVSGSRGGPVRLGVGGGGGGGVRDSPGIVPGVSRA